MNAKVLGLALALLGTGCATDGMAKAPVVKDEFRMPDGTLVVCRMESLTGTHIRERVCRKVTGSAAAARQASDEVVNKPTVQVQTGN